MKRIEAIVDRAIYVVRVVELREPDRLNRALAHLTNLKNELAAGAPLHPSLRKLEDYIGELERKAALTVSGAQERSDNWRFREANSAFH